MKVATRKLAVLMVVIVGLIASASTSQGVWGPCQTITPQKNVNKFKCLSGQCTGYYQMYVAVRDCQDTKYVLCTQSTRAEYSIVQSFGEPCKKDSDCGQGSGTTYSKTTVSDCK